MRKIKHLKKPLALLVVVMMLMTLAPLAMASPEQEAAETLHKIGLFAGQGNDEDGNPVFDLSNVATREQAIIMLIRLLGLEAEALELYESGEITHPFTDVPAWMSPYAAFAFSRGLTYGVAPDQFGVGSPVTATQYLTFTLRALGYDDTAGDFEWDAAWELTDTLGITDGEYSADNNSLIRGEMAVISLVTLTVPMKDSDNTLLEQLIEDGVFDRLAEAGMITDEDVLEALEDGDLGALADMVTKSAESVTTTPGDSDTGDDDDANGNQSNNNQGSGGGSGSGGDSVGGGGGTVVTDITSVNLPSIIAPLSGKPVEVNLTAAGFTGTISWDPDVSVFGCKETYTATVVLTSSAGYKFTGSITPTVVSLMTSAAPISPVTPVGDASGNTLTFDAMFTETSCVIYDNVPMSFDEDEHWFVCGVCSDEISGTRVSHNTTGPDGKCSNCGYDAAACTGGHNAGPAATCTEPQRCLDCGVIIEAATRHIPSALDCTKCEECGVTIPGAGHTSNNAQAINCLVANKCTDCDFEMLAAGSHDFQDYKPDDEATCEDDGTETAECEKCDATDTRAVADSKLRHLAPAQWDCEDGYACQRQDCNETGLGTKTHDDSGNWHHGAGGSNPATNNSRHWKECGNAHCAAEIDADDCVDDSNNPDHCEICESLWSCAHNDQGWDATTGKCKDCDADCPDTDDHGDAATCLDSDTCDTCGYVTAALGHDWSAADGECARSGCTVTCPDTDDHGDAAICLDSDTCDACGFVTSALGHDWESGTPGVCFVCEEECQHESWSDGKDAPCAECGVCHGEDESDECSECGYEKPVDGVFDHHRPVVIIDP